MKKYFEIITLSVVVLLANPSVAQEDKLGTKVIDIVKSYTPTIADAFKSRENTPEKDSVTIAKKKINYTIHSVPVASTFVPDKGKAVRVPSSQKNEKWYNSYVALGYGSLSTLWGDAYISLPIDKESDVSVDIQHHSSQNPTPNTDLASNFSNTLGQVSYRYANKDYQFGASAQGGYRHAHWYGVRDTRLIPLIKDVNIRQSYTQAGLKGYFGVTNSVFKRVDFSVQGIVDGYDTTEIQVRLTPSVGFDFDEQNYLTAIFDINYLNSTFKQGFDDPNKILNQNGLYGVRPAYHFLSEDFYAKIGLGAYITQVGKQNNVKIFPDIEINYDAFAQELILYAGASGDVQQTSYREQSLINPFVSPTLRLVPTFTNYDIFAGIKGKLGGELHYDAKIHYGQVQNLPMFQANSKVTNIQNAYQYDNSFDVIYDDAMVYGISAKIKGNLWNVLQLGAWVSLDSFMTDYQKEAWNIPLFQSSITTDVKIIKNWFVGADLFYVDNRKDIIYKENSLPTPVFEKEIVGLNGYFDLNLHTDFSFKQWGIFLNVNNISSKNYFKWNNYPVQGLQILAGLKYQF